MLFCSVRDRYAGMHSILSEREPSVVGAGHNERIQKQSPILHGETSALENAGRLKPNVYRNSTMVSRQNHGNSEVSSFAI